MLRMRGLTDVPPLLGPTIVTIGNFDGVHRGHQSLIDVIRDYANSRELATIAMTFDPHPAVVHRPSLAPTELTSLRQRLDLLGDHGLDGTIVVHYDDEFWYQDPREFVTSYLVHGLNARAVAVGADVRFGRDNLGDINTLRDLGQELGFEVVEVPHVFAGGRRVSSTWAREALAVGDVVQAASLLGRPHRVDGEVVKGQQRGRTLGFPTANLGGLIDGMIPADGVYAGRLIRSTRADGEYCLPLAISIGTNPTFGEGKRTVEGHVPGRDDLDLYREHVGFEFVARLRDTMAFAAVEDLVAQMHQDVAAAMSLLEEPVEVAIGH